MFLFKRKEVPKFASICLGIGCCQITSEHLAMRQSQIARCSAHVHGTKTLKTLHFKSFLVDRLQVVSRYFWLNRCLIEINHLNVNPLFQHPQLSITSCYWTFSRQFDMSYPYCYYGPWRHFDPFWSELLMKKLAKNRRIGDRLQLLATILAQWWWPGTSIEALDHLYWAMHAVLYQRISVAVKTASNYGTFFDCCFICCCPGGRWGNTTWILTRWQHPKASGLAMDPLHQAMHAVSYRRISSAIKTGRIGGAFDRRWQFQNRHNHS